MDHPHLRARTFGAVTFVTVVVLVLAACSGTSGKPFGAVSTTSSTVPVTPDPEPGLKPPPGWKLPDTRNAVLLPAPSKAKGDPIPVVGGGSTVSGVVNGPDGPVVGATVRIERFVGTASGSTQVPTDGSGHFSLAGAMGGRYRVRAWLQPDLATFDSPTGFVADGQQLTLSPTLERHNAVSLQVASSTASLTTGAAGGVRALLTRETVDANGIVQQGAVGGAAVTLAAGDGLSIDSPNPATTDAKGSASWVVTCTADGAHTVTATTPDATANATLPACGAAESSSSTTSTTAAAGPGQ